MSINDMVGNISTKFQVPTIFNKKIKKTTKPVAEGQNTAVYNIVFFSISS
jgi:hypothetical protein